MSTYNLSVTFQLGVRMDSDTTSSILAIPLITLTQVKEPLRIDLIEVSGTS